MSSVSAALILSIFIFAHVFVVEGFRKTCNFSIKCKCYKYQNGSVVADCSYLHLDRIPKLPNVLQGLSFHNNKITRLENHVFISNNKLLSLDISKNLIHTIDTSAFDGLLNLQYLNLEGNKLSLGNKSFGNDPFRFLINLERLNMKKNFVDFFQPNMSFLTSLQFLEMDFYAEGSNPGHLGEQFNELKSLENLDLSGISGNCKVHLITPQSFENIGNIKNLNLSGCKIWFIYNGTFRQLSKLAVLDISDNTCLKFDSLENVTFGLQFTNIRVLKLNKIHKVFDMNTFLKSSHVKHLQNTSLEEVYIDSNRVQQIETGALLYFPKTVKFASWRDNQFSFGPYLFDIRNTSVNHVDISYMFTYHKLTLESENCPFDMTCQKFPNHRQSYVQEKVNINSSFSLAFGTLNKIWDNSVSIPIPYNLQQLDYKGCGLRYSFPELAFSNNSLKSIDLSQNVIAALVGPIRNLPNLTNFDLSTNFCSNLSTMFFSRDFKSLQRLHLENNMIGLVLPEDRIGETFQHLHSLTKLNLSQNRIPKLSPWIFKSLIYLEYLDLSNNMLSNVDFNISHMKNMKYLGLKNNRILFFSFDLRRQLDLIRKKNSKLAVDLSGNPLLCTCETLDFIYWISETKVQLINRLKYQCQLSNLSLIALHNSEKVYNKLKRDCMSYQNLTLILIAVIFLFLLILCAGLVFRYRWKLRYLYYMIKIRSHKRMTPIDEEDTHDFMYGAFVSYSDEDRLFVHRNLLQKLEKENGIELCLHKRNFLPGNDIATNITSAIHNSRKTLVIMSRNFLNSYWCMFEFNMARMESIYERNQENILFLVFLEQLTSRDIPLHVLELVQNQSYIEYPNDEYGDQVFWSNLIKVLK